MAEIDLSKLIKPILNQLCEYYEYNRAGTNIELSQVYAQLNSLLQKAKSEAFNNVLLQKKFSVIEIPLVFFIDYFIIESKFSFSKDYRPLALNYNELSGDEKFFDLLDVIIDDSSVDVDVIQAFYTMLMLGFDGIFKRDTTEVLNRIDKCALKLQLNQAKNKNEIENKNSTNENLEKFEKDTLRDFFSQKRNVLFVIILVTFLCILANTISIYHYLSEFNTSVNEAVEASSPFVFEEKPLLEDSDFSE